MITNERLATIERVCDKRHSRLLAFGLSDRDASDRVVDYLTSIIDRFGLNRELVAFCDGLRQGYLAELK